MTFSNVQKVFASHMRDPHSQPPPEGVEERRLKIYRDLIFNNIEGFLAGTFPVLRSLYDDAEWQLLVRDFIAEHQAESPYFLKISEEFLSYLQSSRGEARGDWSFMQELAHYEWVELALDVSQESLPAARSPGDDILKARPQVSPLVWLLSYQFPVHQLGPGYRPQRPPEQPTFLIVYRGRDDTVEFIESNAVTVRLLQILQDGSVEDGYEAIARLAGEMQHPSPETLVPLGRDLMRDLWSKDVLV